MTREKGVSLEAKDSEVSRTTFRLKKDLLRKLKVYAAQNDTSVTVILNQLAENFLEKKK